jgi:hypothetical protein
MVEEMSDTPIRFCAKCGRKLKLTVRESFFGFDGDMEETGRCPAYRAWSQNHDFVLLREWNVGPRYSRYTGEKLR